MAKDSVERTVFDVLLNCKRYARRRIPLERLDLGRYFPLIHIPNRGHSTAVGEVCAHGLVASSVGDHHGEENKPVFGVMSD